MIAPGILLGAVVGALANRHRGGWLPTGHTQVARLNFSLIMSAVMMVALAFGGIAPFSWWAFALVPGWWFGCFAGHAEGMWIGRNNLLEPYAVDVAKWTRDAVNLAGSGIWNVAIPAGVLWWIGAPAWWVLAAGGLCKPLAYDIGWRLPLRAPGFTQGPETGESVYGAVLGAACVLAAV